MNINQIKDIKETKFLKSSNIFFESDKHIPTIYIMKHPGKRIYKLNNELFLNLMCDTGGNVEEFFSRLYEDKTITWFLVENIVDFDTIDWIEF